MSLVEKFDFYSDVLNFGNRTDIEDGDWGGDGYEYLSWEAEPTDYQPVRLVPSSTIRAATIKVYSDTEERKILVAWREVYDE